MDYIHDMHTMMYTEASTIAIAAKSASVLY